MKNKRTTENEIRIARINLAGVIITAILGLIGVALTAYLGYMEKLTSQSQPVTIAATVTGIAITPNTPSTPISTNAPPSSLLIWTSCALTALAFIVAFTFFSKHYWRYFREAYIDMQTMRVHVDRRERASLIAKSGLDASAKSVFPIYGTTSIGRSSRHANLIMHSDKEASLISLLHCTILDEDGSFWIRDEQSNNGTYLNGKKLLEFEKNLLRDGDTISLAPERDGGVVFTFVLVNIT